LTNVTSEKGGEFVHVKKDKMLRMLHMEKGEMDEATAKKMQNKMKLINQELEALQKKNK